MASEPSEPSEPSKPTFVGVGGMKCASTWVSECLREHPQVLLSKPKETAYFLTRTGIDDYLRFFEGHPGQRYAAVGEFTPPLFGRAEIAQFDTLALPGWGFILAIVASVLIAVGLYFHRKAYKPLIQAEES